MGDLSRLLADANEQIMRADNKEMPQELLGTYERVLEQDASNYKALWSLGRYNVVMVLGYTESPSEKEEYNLNTIHYCERPMDTHSDLEWVIAQDPHKRDSPYPANVHFQRDAKAMLAHADE